MEIYTSITQVEAVKSKAWGRWLTIEEESLEYKDTETWIDGEEQAPRYDKCGRIESIPDIFKVNSSDPTNGSTDMHYDACRLTDGEIEEKLQGFTAISP